MPGAVRIGGYTADDVGNIERFLDSLRGDAIRTYARPMDEHQVWYVLKDGGWVYAPEKDIRARWVEITEAMLTEAEAMGEGATKAAAFRWVHRSRNMAGIRTVLDAAAEALYVAPQRFHGPDGRGGS